MDWYAKKVILLPFNIVIFTYSFYTGQNDFLLNRGKDMKKSKILIVISFFFAIQHIIALTDEQVRTLTNGLAITATAITYTCTPPHNGLMPIDTSGIKEGYGFPLVMSGVTFITSRALFNWILSRYTPERRYSWATDELMMLETQYLFDKEITQDNLSLMLQESGCEASEIALVTAFLIIQKFDKQLTYLFDELTLGIQDTKDDTLRDQMHDLAQEVQTHLKRVRANESIIKAQPQWAAQWNVYEQRIIEREKLSHMQTHVVLHVNDRS